MNSISRDLSPISWRRIRARTSRFHSLGGSWSCTVQGPHRLTPPVIRSISRSRAQRGPPSEGGGLRYCLNARSGFLGIGTDHGFARLPARDSFQGLINLIELEGGGDDFGKRDPVTAGAEEFDQVNEALEAVASWK